MLLKLLAFALPLQVTAMESSICLRFNTAGESQRIAGLLEVREPEFSKKACANAAQVIESHSRLNSSMGVARVWSASSAADAPCAAAVALTCPLA